MLMVSSLVGPCFFEMRLSYGLMTGIFGDFVQDDIVVEAGSTTDVEVTWEAQSHGT